MSKGKRTAQLIGVIGGGLGLIFAIFLGPLFSATLLAGKGGWGLYITLILLPPIIVIIGGLLVENTRVLGSSLMWIGGVTSIIGYGISPAIIFGILFIYGGVRGFSKPV